MRFHIISLILLFTESFIFADQIDPDLIQLRRELVQIQNELKSDGPKSFSREVVQGSESSEPDINNNLTDNSLNELSVVSNTPTDVMSQIRKELMNIQKELSEIGGPPSRTYKPSNRELKVNSKEEILILNEIEKDNKLTNVLEPIDEKSLIRQELLNIQKALKILNESDQLEFDKFENQTSQKEVSSFTEKSLPQGLGSYIMPFFGFTKTDNLKWKTVLGDIDLDQKSGHSFGYRIGHRWNILFLDFQMSYHENKIKELDLGGINLSHGKSKGIDYHTSLGAKMYITPQAYFSMGGGLGASDKSIKIDSIEEEDILWSYQVFAGLNYFPTNHFQIGLRYRWLKAEAMNLFSSQKLHLAELSLGYSL